MAPTSCGSTAAEISFASDYRANSDLAITASEIIGTWDGDLLGGKVYGDANFARIYGMDEAEVAAGKPLGHYYTLMHPDDALGAYAARDRMMAKQGDYYHEHRLFRPDGTVLWVLARGRLVYDDTGKPIRFIGVSVDITQRRLAEARQAFLLKLQDSLRGLSEPAEILSTAATLLGQYLGAARIGYSEIQPDNETVLITNGYVDGAAPVNGLFPLMNFGAHLADAMRQGRTIVYDDAQSGPSGASEFWANAGTRAHVSVPLVRDGRYTGSLYVTHLKPYRWTPEEVALVEAVAARIWDAAERGRAEARLRDSEERLRLVLDSSGLGAWEYDVATRETIRSARHDEIFGYPAPVADWPYERFEAHIAEPDRADVRAAFRSLVHEGVDCNIETRMVRQDGSRGWIRICAKAHIGPDGKTTRLLGTVADITERKSIENTAVETAAKFEMFAQTMPAMAWTSRPDGSIDWFNARVPEYCGVSEADMKPNGWAPVHPDDMAASVRTWQEAVASGEPYTMEYRIQRHDGAFRWHITRAVPVRDADGAIKLWVGTSADIEDQKNAERALAELNATLEHQVIERTTELMLAEASLRQSQKMEAVGQLTGGLAHDFNNLLTVVSGGLEMLETRLAQGRFDDLDRYLNTAKMAAQRAAALTHRLLAFSRRQMLDPKPTDVNHLVAGMDELLRRTMGPHVSVTMVSAEALWSVLADRNQLENALLNLCINARDAMPNGGSLTIETTNHVVDEIQARKLELEAGDYISLSVSDTGDGMAPEVIARAFDPFFTTKPIGEGTGLGLSMVYGFARQSGGQARILSTLGEGTKVSLYLRRYHGSEEPIDARTDLPETQRGTGETVLVVDDEATVRMLVNEVLEEFGYRALEAENGPAGLKILDSAQRVDLLITDIGLPGGMNGRQLADAALVARPGLKILFITGYAESAIIGEGHLKPGMHIMTKPFSLETLGRRIQQIIAET